MKNYLDTQISIKETVVNERESIKLEEIKTALQKMKNNKGTVSA